MTVEKPADFAHVWLMNATEEPVDVYLNYADEPKVTDLKGLGLGIEFQVKGKDDTPYGVYTFSVRPKDQRGAAVLAASSIDFSEGRSFTAILHPMPDGSYRVSVYENDFTPSDAPRMTVRHTARPGVLTWRISPKDFKIEIPVDEREGTLRSGQWQVATNIVQNDYGLEVFLGGELVAQHPDFEIEHEKDRTAYLVGDPYPTDDPGTLTRFIVQQEFKLPRGAPPEAEVTPPAEPYSTGDHNLLIECHCSGIEVWQTNRASKGLSAVDPDGIVTDLSITDVVPYTGGIVIPDHGVIPSPEVGGTATAVVEVSDNVPPGHYEVTVTTNMRSLGQRAKCSVPVTVSPITIGRLRSLVDDYVQSGAMEAGVAGAILESLDRAEQNLATGNDVMACGDLKEALALVGSAKDKGIHVPAAEHLDREIKALRANLGCG